MIHRLVCKHAHLSHDAESRCELLEESTCLRQCLFFTRTLRAASSTIWHEFLQKPFEAHNAPSDCDSVLSEQTRAHMNQPIRQNTHFPCVFWEHCFDYFPIGCTTIFILRFSIEVAWSNPVRPDPVKRSVRSGETVRVERL